MKYLARLRTFIPEGQGCSHFVNPFTILRMCSTIDEGFEDTKKRLSNGKITKTKINRKKTTSQEIDELLPPNNCCMSGCANCVWIRYAEKLTKVLKASDKDVQKLIMEKVEDPNMRAFLSMELRNRNILNE